MNVHEYGIWLYFSTGFDMSGFTALSIIFTKPDGTVQTVTDPDVSIGNVDVETFFGLFPANLYLKYRFAPSPGPVYVDQVGEWSARCTYQDNTQYLISDVATFTVNP